MLTTSIRRTYFCESAHFLPHVPDGHKCKNMHGHHYRFDIEIAGELGDSGWLMDFWELDEIFQPIFVQLDHHLLNEIAGLDNPTAENIAAWIYLILKPLITAHSPDLWLASVVVHETPDCSATLRDNREPVRW